MKQIIFSLLILSGAALAKSSPQLYQESYEKEALYNFSGAISALAKLPSAEKRSYLFQFRRAWLFYRLGQYQQSVSAYKKAAKIAPRSIEAPMAMLLPQMGLRRWADAHKTAKAILQQDKKNIIARQRMAWILFNLGRYADAEQVYRDILTDYPSDLDMMAGLGWSLLKRGDKSGAKKSFQKILNISPKHGSALNGLRWSR